MVLLAFGRAYLPFFAFNLGWEFFKSKMVHISNQKPDFSFGKNEKDHWNLSLLEKKKNLSLFLSNTI